MTSSFYPPDQQVSNEYTDSNSLANNNPYGGAIHPHGNNASSYDGYDRRYEGPPAMGYDSYGHPNPYGYAPQSYYQQDFSQGAYHQPPEYRGYQNQAGGNPSAYYNYDPNRPPFDQDSSQDNSQPR